MKCWIDAIAPYAISGQTFGKAVDSFIGLGVPGNGGRVQAGSITFFFIGINQSTTTRTLLNKPHVSRAINKNGGTGVFANGDAMQIKITSLSLGFSQTEKV